MRMDSILAKVGEECRKIDRKEAEQLITMLLSARRVFVHGAGRSGLVARAFAMRLMHLGMFTHVVGETTTPAIMKGDLLVLISGSGETSTIPAAAEIAKKKGAFVALITSDPDSKAAKEANLILKIYGREKEKGEKDYMARQLSGAVKGRPLLGSLFELSAVVFLDALIEELMERQGKTEEHMQSLHANLE
jgi:6-phospho-3-hexuloisomerase